MLDATGDLRQVGRVPVSSEGNQRQGARVGQVPHARAALPCFVSDEP